ncbi:hypothetical protein L1987_18566 [Smallanthus sonchifolius]|uniref:Uncharacterized protein n=1 Tax=Smallanthus sonchifolius TaxID=185202 RepID=A0ACB9J147_9ASTR|nr:hypothetical protein L1987_18566 [Smallanthus sonchifolius]
MTKWNTTRHAFDAFHSDKVTMLPLKKDYYGIGYHFMEVPYNGNFKHIPEEKKDVEEVDIAVKNSIVFTTDTAKNPVLYTAKLTNDEVNSLLTKQEGVLQEIESKRRKRERRRRKEVCLQANKGNKWNTNGKQQVCEKKAFKRVEKKNVYAPKGSNSHVEEESFKCSHCSCSKGRGKMYEQQKKHVENKVGEYYTKTFQKFVKEGCQKSTLAKNLKTKIFFRKQKNQKHIFSKYKQVPAKSVFDNKKQIFEIKASKIGAKKQCVD